MENRYGDITTIRPSPARTPHLGNLRDLDTGHALYPTINIPAIRQNGAMIHRSARSGQSR